MILLFVLLVWVTGCEDKKPDASPMVIENTTQIFTDTDKKKQIQKQSNTSQNTSVQVESTTKATPVTEKRSRTNNDSYTFDIYNAQNTLHKLTLSYNKLTFHDIQASTVVLHVFADTCTPCVAQIVSFSKLQKKYGKKLFMVSLSASNTQNSEIHSFMQQKKVTHFVSMDKKNDTLISELFSSLEIEKNTTLPLTVIYKDGNYYSHFEGAVPIEMINHDIQQNIEK